MNRMRYWHSKEDYDRWKRDYVISTTEEYNDLYRRIKKPIDFYKKIPHIIIDGSIMDRLFFTYLFKRLRRKRYESS